MQTANFVSQWNKFSSLDCDFKQSIDTQYGKNSSFLLYLCHSLCWVHSSGTDLATSFTTLYKNNTSNKIESMTFKLNPMNAKCEMKRERRLIVETCEINWFLMVSFREQQRQFGENFVWTVIITWFFRCWVFLLDFFVLGKIIKLQSIYFRTGSAFSKNNLSTRFSYVLNM